MANRNWWETAKGFGGGLASAILGGGGANPGGNIPQGMGGGWGAPSITPPSSAPPMYGNPGIATTAMMNPDFSAPGSGMPNPGFVTTRSPDTRGTITPQGAPTLGGQIISGLGDFLGGNDGSNALMLAGLGMNAWDARQGRKRYDEDRERAIEEEEERKRRYDSNSGARQALLAQMYGRLDG